MKKLQINPLFNKYKIPLFILVGLFVLCIGGRKIYYMKQQGFFLADSAFEYKEIPISYITTIPDANADGFLEVAERMGAGSEELLTPNGKATFTFWVFSKKSSNDNDPNGFRVEFPVLKEGQAYIISYGRKILKMRYTEASTYPQHREKYLTSLDYGGADMYEKGAPYGVPLMSKEYAPSTVYVYAVELSELADFEYQSITPSKKYSESFEIEE